MASPNTPMTISTESQDAVVRYLSNWQSLYASSYSIRNQLEQRDRAYYREQDWSKDNDRAKSANQTGDMSKIQNVTVPVVMPQVESALAYLTDVFLTGYPIFATVAPPAHQEALKQFDALITDNSIIGGWPSELMKTMRNGLKHDLGAVEVVWEKRKIFSIGTPELSNITQGTKQDELYEGNFIKDLDPYNLILDIRVSPEKNHLIGEVAGYTECVSAVVAKMRMDDLDKTKTMNFRKAFESGSAAVSTSASDAGYYIPTINPEALLPVGQRTMGTNWMAWVGLESKQAGIKYHDTYEWTVLYCRIIPALLNMRVENATQVQIWKFIVINRETVIYAERQTNAHNMLPIVVCKPTNDGMGYQSKSFGQNAETYQQIASSLMNSGLASQRRKVYDRILYDPTRVRKSDIENTSPVARIPVRNTQFGKGFEGAVQSMQYSDDGVAQTIQISQEVVRMAEIGNGQNRVTQGQFQKGNKTRKEFETVMGNANSRQVMQAIGLEYTFWTPIKHIIKCNILQFQQATKIVDQQSQEEVNVDPTELRKALITFKISDGLLNSEKLASLDIGTQIVQAATQLPMIAQQYDIGAIVSYLWKLQGVDWLDDFKRDETGQAAYIQQMQQNTMARGEMRNQAPPPPEEGGMPPGQPPTGAPGVPLQ